jgi:hypothetical protein
VDWYIFEINTRSLARPDNQIAFLDQIMVKFVGGMDAAILADCADLLIARSAFTFILQEALDRAGQGFTKLPALVFYILVHIHKYSP